MARRDVFICVDTGEVVHLDNPATSAELADVTETTSKRRASHVEPVSLARRCLFHVLRFTFGESGRVAEWTRGPFFAPWRVNLKPSAGPILPASYNDRAAAIAAEIEWLADHPENWL